MGNNEITDKPAMSWRRRIIIAIAVLSVIPALGFGLQWTAYVQDKPERDKLEVIAGKLAPPSTWTMNSEQTMGGFGCLGMDVACNSLNRAYSLPSKITPEEFRALAIKVGADPNTTEGDCQDDPAFGSKAPCMVHGTVDGHGVVMWFDTEYGPHIVIDIRKGS